MKSMPNQYTMNCQGKLLDLSTPMVMGILNTTPDSFFADSRKQAVSDALETADQMVEDGASILDVGGQSTRPGAHEVGIEEELKRVIPVITELAKQHPETPISIDTYHAEVARKAIGAGASIVNDVSGGTFDQAMFDTVGEIRVPYILMHTSGRPDVMQNSPSYTNVVTDLIKFLSARVNQLRQLGVNDIVIDPGFGFGKSLEHNFQLLNDLAMFHILDLPILVGVSRKSMINNVLLTSPIEALNGTTALHMALLERGAHILRVHDVKEAIEVIKLYSFARSVAQT